MLVDFRDFLLRGNVISLAVAVVISAAFGAVVNSFVKDILTPLLVPHQRARLFDLVAYRWLGRDL